MAVSLGRLEFTEQSSGEERAAQRASFGNLQRVPSSSQKSTDGCIHARKLLEARERTPSRNRHNQGSHRLVIVRVPTSQSGTPGNTWSIG